MALVLFRSSARTFHKASSALVFVQTCTLVGFSVASAASMVKKKNEDVNTNDLSSFWLQGAAVVAVALVSVIRRTQKRVCLSMRVLGNGKDVEVETVALTGLSRYRVMPMTSFRNTNSEWPGKGRFWTVAQYSIGNHSDYFLLENGLGKSTNVNFLNRTLSGGGI